MTDTNLHLTIRTDKGHGEADLVFEDVSDDVLEKLLDELHHTVIDAVDGVSVQGNVSDFVVAIRKGDFDQVVQRLRECYERDGVQVTVR